MIKQSNATLGSTTMTVGTCPQTCRDTLILPHLEKEGRVKDAFRTSTLRKAVTRESLRWRRVGTTILDSTKFSGITPTNSATPELK
jgi:hypothetical protein